MRYRQFTAIVISGILMVPASIFAQTAEPRQTTVSKANDLNQAVDKASNALEKANIQFYSPDGKIPFMEMAKDLATTKEVRALIPQSQGLSSPLGLHSKFQILDSGDLAINIELMDGTFKQAFVQRQYLYKGHQSALENMQALNRMLETDMMPELRSKVASNMKVGTVIQKMASLLIPQAKAEGKDPAALMIRGVIEVTVGVLLCKFIGVINKDYKTKTESEKGVTALISLGSVAGIIFLFVHGAIDVVSGATST